MTTDPTRNLRRGQDLAARGLVEPGRVAAIDAVARRYALAITPALADLIDPADPDDPIARQFIPDPAELERAPEELVDPIGDQAHSPVKGIVHRYPDRVLLKPVAVCPVYCRFCFRRESVGPDADALTPAELDRAIDYIRAHREIWEAILSGGDPLMLSPARVAAVVGALDRIEHLGVIRIHTRMPIADPARIDAELLAALVADKAVYVVVHCNHPRELSAAALAACRRLTDSGVPVLSQTVLLKGVNDDAATLEALLRTLVRHRIKPYYLHHADLAPGTAHFRTTIAAGRRLVRALAGRVSGLCQPPYVLDIPGGAGKVRIGPEYPRADGHVEDWRGGLHAYPPPAAALEPGCVAKPPSPG